MATNDGLLPDWDALGVWHEHRASVLGALTCILFCVWIYLQTPRETQIPKSPVNGLKTLKTPEKVVPIPIAQDSTPVAERIAEKDINTISTTPTTVTKGPKRIKGELRKADKTPSETPPSTASSNDQHIQVLVFYSSLTGTTEKTVKSFAETLTTALRDTSSSDEDDNKTSNDVFLTPQLLDLTEVDYDEYFITAPKSPDTHYFYLLMLPSYNIDTINDNFLEHLRETHHDFRIDKGSLSGVLGYSVFGIGDREGWPTEEEGFCFQAKEVDRWMAKLTNRKRGYPLGMGDAKRDVADRLNEWVLGVVDVIKMVARTGSLGEGVPGSGDADESEDEYISDDDGEVVVGEEEQEEEEQTVPVGKTAKRIKSNKKKGKKNTSSLDDVEDLGRIMKASRTDANGEPAPAATAAPIAVDFTTYGKTTSVSKRPQQTIKEMVPKNSPTYASLTKQGYAIVGSHSGVKICRWTKSALRGRGSCYKFSFYGIASHQCMETTPSLSCSNKCVFCWRHGTNPVGTTWRWVVDPPDLIFDGVKRNHYQKIKTMRGVPGVRAERFAEAMRIRHCALSLVGEPIFYPHIDEFLGMLHGERISSFLVCNAQHPDQLATLKAVTQLYVSIDASNRESLRRIDRPLHRDFWERFQRCLDILREKRFKHRTVFRLTLVKGFNVDDEAKGYADLVEKALPCFVEIKGVTYCGTTSGSAGLSMTNVPFWAEVVEFVEALNRELNKRGLDYGPAAEHAHSCCALLASGRFRNEETGKWHTRIDYQRFFELLEERGADGDWRPEDYADREPTPEWAAWGNGGFDPRDDRVDRKGRKIEM